MKARIVLLLVTLATVLSLTAPAANAGAGPITTVGAFFAAVDSGDHEAAVAMFAPDAVATLARGEAYQGPEELLAMVELLAHPGRYHNIARAEVAGDTVSVVVHVYDDGIRWGEDEIVIEVQDGKLHTYHEQAFRLRLG